MTHLFAATAISIAMILLLHRGDPKRRRTAGLRGSGHSAGTRRFLVLATLLPGVGLAIIGDTAAFLIWLGACAVSGWLATQWQGKTRPTP